MPKEGAGGKKPTFKTAINREGRVVASRPGAPLFYDRSGRPVSVEEAKRMYEVAETRRKAAFGEKSPRGRKKR